MKLAEGQRAPMKHFSMDLLFRLSWFSFRSEDMVSNVPNFDRYYVYQE